MIDLLLCSRKDKQAQPKAPELRTVSAVRLKGVFGEQRPRQKTGAMMCNAVIQGKTE